MFKVGDRVRKKDGNTFSNGEFVVTVQRKHETRYKGPSVLLLETNTHIEVSSLVLDKPAKKRFAQWVKEN